MPATDHPPLTGARQLSVHAGAVRLAEVLAARAEVVGTNTTPAVRALVKRKRQRVMLSFRVGATKPGGAASLARG